MQVKLFKRIIGLAMAFMIVASLSISAFAANTADTVYYKWSVSAGTWKTSASRYKEDTSKVYVYPHSSPSGKTRVKTMCYVGGVETNKTKNSKKYVVLADDSKYAITNYVYEDGDRTTGYGVEMWLSLTPNSGTGSISGLWSPDWTGNGTGVTIV